MVSWNSPKKQTNSFLLLRWIRLFVFWENSRTPKSPFEIIWPLAGKIWKVFKYFPIYRIVASRRVTIQKIRFFCFYKSRILTCQFFFRNKTFLFVVRSLRYSGYLTNTWCVCQVAGISKRLDNFYFLTPHVTNLI